MPITELSIYHYALGQTGGTTGGDDTTGADFILLTVSYYSALSGFPAVPTDNKGNTYTLVPPTGGVHRENESGVRHYYCIGASVGTGHTWTVARAGSADIYAAIIIHTASGVASFDAEAGQTTNNVNSTSLSTGSLTPAGNGAYLVAGLSVNVVSSVSVDSGLTFTEEPDQAGVCVTGATGSIVQNTAAALNATFSWTNAVKGGASLVSFLPSTPPGLTATLSEVIKISDSASAALVSSGYSQFVMVSP